MRIALMYLHVRQMPARSSLTGSATTTPWAAYRKYLGMRMCPAGQRPCVSVVTHQLENHSATGEYVVAPVSQPEIADRFDRGCCWPAVVALARETTGVKISGTAAPSL